MTTILHVEDDDTLAELVAEAFEAFGFRGSTVLATTVEEARKILLDVAQYPTLDLIISDIHLPDGTGLDVVQAVRTSPVHAHVPILILSGETDPALVSQAYALGANTYISKGARGRSVIETMRALHDHWLRDAQLPPPTHAPRTHDLIAAGVRIRMQKARLYMEIAEVCGVDSPQAEFWMELALREGNLANLMSFLLRQLDGRELADESRLEISAIQARELRLTYDLEQQPVYTPAQAEPYLQRVVMYSCSDAAPVARAMSQLFPAVPVAMSALSEVTARSLENMAVWIENHASDQKLGEYIPQLREGAKQLRESAPLAGP